MKTIKLGAWEFPIEVICRGRDHLTVNINNGAIFVFHLLSMADRTIICGGNYDTMDGPPINGNQLYIWNSKELNTKGKLKKTFTLNYTELEALL